MLDQYLPPQAGDVLITTERSLRRSRGERERERETSFEYYCICCILCYIVLMHYILTTYIGAVSNLQVRKLRLTKTKGFAQGYTPNNNNKKDLLSAAQCSGLESTKTKTSGFISQLCHLP